MLLIMQFFVRMSKFQDSVSFREIQNNHCGPPITMLLVGKTKSNFDPEYVRTPEMLVIR